MDIFNCIPGLVDVRVTIDGESLHRASPAVAVIAGSVCVGILALLLATVAVYVRRRRHLQVRLFCPIL